MPVAITNSVLHRYADGDFSKNGKFMFCVCEDHSNASDHIEPVNTIVAVNLKTGEEEVAVCIICCCLFD